MEEKNVWQGGPSQRVNLGLFIVCGLFFWTVVPLFFILAAYLKTKSTRYEITTQRLRITSGVFSRRVDEIELYRVKDSTLLEPFLLRTQGLGNIAVLSNDTAMPNVLLHAVAQARDVREKLRNAYETRRDEKRVRVAEVE
jgi:uncharacterized membrane protein YdbT with pleckstrin-like domain